LKTALIGLTVGSPRNAVTSLLATTALADPIHVAARVGDLAGVQAELDKGVDVTAKDENDEAGWTPLHVAAEFDHKEIAELLISKGADVNAKDVGGETPLDWANDKETADLLRTHGGKTGEELALMPHLEYGKDQRPFGFSFTAEDEKNYVVEVTQDFKQWGKLETIKGTGKQVKFIDPRQPLVPFKRNFYRVKLVE